MKSKNKLFFLFLISLIISISFCLAVSFGISPEKIKLSGKQGETMCNNFSILGDGGNNFYGEIKWSNQNSRRINEYNLSSEELELNVDYPIKAKTAKYQICISTKKGGALLWGINV